MQERIADAVTTWLNAGEDSPRSLQIRGLWRCIDDCCLLPHNQTWIYFVIYAND